MVGTVAVIVVVVVVVGGLIDDRRRCSVGGQVRDWGRGRRVHALGPVSLQ